MSQESREPVVLYSEVELVAMSRSGTSCLSTNGYLSATISPVHTDTSSIVISFLRPAYERRRSDWILIGGDLNTFDMVLNSSQSDHDNPNQIQRTLLSARAYLTISRETGHASSLFLRVGTIPLASCMLASRY